MTRRTVATSATSLTSTVETTLNGRRRTRAWGHADLVTSAGDTGDEYVARISLGIRGPTAAVIESRLARAT